MPVTAPLPNYLADRTKLNDLLDDASVLNSDPDNRINLIAVADYANKLTEQKVTNRSRLYKLLICFFRRLPLKLCCGAFFRSMHVEAKRDLHIKNVTQAIISTGREGNSRENRDKLLNALKPIHGAKPINTHSEEWNRQLDLISAWLRKKNSGIGQSGNKSYVTPRYPGRNVDKSKGQSPVDPSGGSALDEKRKQSLMDILTKLKNQYGDPWLPHFSDKLNELFKTTYTSPVTSLEFTEVISVLEQMIADNVPALIVDKVLLCFQEASLQNSIDREVKKLIENRQTLTADNLDLLLSKGIRFHARTGLYRLADMIIILASFEYKLTEGDVINILKNNGTIHGVYANLEEAKKQGLLTSDNIQKILDGPRKEREDMREAQFNRAFGFIPDEIFQDIFKDFNKYKEYIKDDASFFNFFFANTNTKDQTFEHAKDNNTQYTFNDFYKHAQDNYGSRDKKDSKSTIQSEKQACEVLGIDLQDRNDEDKIKKAYRKMALKHHPDKNKGKEALAKEKFIKVLAARELLMARIQ